MDAGCIVLMFGGIVYWVNAELICWCRFRVHLLLVESCVFVLLCFCKEYLCVCVF